VSGGCVVCGACEPGETCLVNGEWAEPDCPLAAEERAEVTVAVSEDTTVSIQRACEGTTGSLTDGRGG
jgi:hypothetical protein